MITFVFQKQIERLKQASNLTIILAAVLFLFLSLLSALLIPHHAVAIFLASTSSMAAGFVLALTLPRTLALFFDEQSKGDREAKEKLKKAIQEQQNLLAQLHRHERMQINTESIKPLLNLTLLNVETKIRDFLKTDITGDESHKAGMIGFRKELKTRTYLFNVLHSHFECQLGVDLAGLRFERVSGDRVFVTGYKSKFQGLKNQKHDDELLLRVDTDCDLETGKEIGHRVSYEDAAVLKKALEMRQHIHDRMSTGIEFEHLDKSLMQMTSAFLQAIFSPLNLKLEFTNASATERGLGLIDFLETESLKNQAETKRLESRYREIQIELQ